MRAGNALAVVTVFAAVLAGMGAHADDVAEIAVRTRPDVTRVGAPFNIIVQTRGTPVGSISLPTVENLSIDPTPVGSANTFVYQDGRIVVSTETRFVAVSQVTGTITIPPIHAEIAGQVLASEPVEIEILPLDSPPPTDAQQARDRAIPIEEAFFIRSEVDKTEVYQGEGVLLGLALWRVQGVTASTRRGSHIGPPDTTGFYSIDLPPAGENRQRMVDGVAYMYEVRQTRRLLFPTATGDLTIGGWGLEGEVRVPDTTSPFASAARRRIVPLEAEPVTITVKPLPPRPAGFSGAVGQFRLSSNLSSQGTYLGQPITLVVEVSGTGNPDAISAPPLPPIPGIHASTPRASTSVDKDNRGIRVNKRFEYTLTPTEMGEITIPPVSFVYFDPEREVYDTLEGREYPIRVGRPAGGTARTFVTAGDSRSEQFAALAEDIAPPAEAPAVLSRSTGIGMVALAAGYVIPVIGYAGLAASLMRRRRYERDHALARAHGARGRMEQRLRGIARAPEPAVELYRALSGYVADCLDAPEAGMTPDDLAELCSGRGLPPEAYEGVAKTLRACERVRYAGGTLSVTEVEALLEAAEVHIAQFDDALREARAA